MKLGFCKVKLKLIVPTLPLLAIDAKGSKCPNLLSKRIADHNIVSDKKFALKKKYQFTDESRYIKARTWRRSGRRLAI